MLPRPRPALGHSTTGRSSDEVRLARHLGGDLAMTDYNFDDHDVDPAALERARLLRERGAPLAEGSAQWRYLPRPGSCRPRRSGGAVPTSAPSRAGDSPTSIPKTVASSRSSATPGAATGFAVEACGSAGAAVKRRGRTLRRFFNLMPVRLSTGLFHAIVDKQVDKATLTEGHLAKCIAAAALFPDRNVYGFGCPCRGSARLSRPRPRSSS